MPAHVTVLYPFADGSAITEELLSSLEEIAAPVPSFDFTLIDVGRFGDVVYLRPEPADPFVGLTNALHERWPAHPPYEGRFDSVVPHLTIADDPQASSHLAEIEAVLPLHERASELMLIGRTARGRWRELRRLPLAA